MMSKIRRVVTGHDAEGHAIVQRDDVIAATPVEGGRAGFAVAWATDRVPVDNADPTDGATRAAGLALKNGSVLRFVDFAPGSSSPMHRTNSIDYGVVLKGEIVLELDRGEERVLRAGELCVQRGTMHAWHNRTGAWAQMVFVLIDAEPVTIAGRTLEPTH